MSDRISIDPEAVARDGADIHELAAEVRAIDRWFNDSVDALGKCWGEGDAVAESFEENYVPNREGFGVFLTTLGMAFEPEQRFENNDGSDIIFDTDYLGDHRGLSVLPGPFATPIKKVKV